MAKLTSNLPPDIHQKVLNEKLIAFRTGVPQLSGNVTAQEVADKLNDVIRFLHGFVDNNPPARKSVTVV